MWCRRRSTASLPPEPQQRRRPPNDASRSPNRSLREAVMTAQPPRAGWTSPQSIEAVRPLVRETLLAVPSFGKLEPAEQRALAANMVKVLSYISHPNGIDPATRGATPPVARPEPALARAQA